MSTFKEKKARIKRWDFLISFSSLLLGIILVQTQHSLESQYYLCRWAIVFFEIVSFCCTVIGALGILYSALAYLHNLNEIGNKIAGFQDIIDKQQAELKELQKCHTLCSTKTNSIAVWNKYNNPETIRLNISNMDDYIIQVPVYLAMNAFKSEKLYIKKNNCHTDEGALNDVLKNGGIALADPYYVQSGKLYNKCDLIILSPLLIKNPLKHLQKKEGTPSSILVYDNTQDSTAGRLKELSSNTTRKKMKPLNDFVKKLLEIMVQDSFWGSFSQMEDDTRNRCKREIASFNKKVKSDEHIEEWYEMFIYILAFYGGYALPEEKQKLKNAFEEFSDFYLMEPELSFIEKIILENETSKSYTVKSLTEEETDVIFTSIITTKSYLRENPIIILKFLRSIRIGILRCHTLIENKSKLFDELNNSQLEEKYKASIQTILHCLQKHSEMEITSDLYPKDLVVYTSRMPESDIAFKNLRKINRDKDYIYQYILTDEDIEKNSEIKFILEGLQL